MNRKARKIRIHCHENYDILKSFCIWVILGFFGFFNFMNIVIVRNVIVLFECVLFQNISFNLRNIPLSEETEKSVRAVRKTDLN